MTAVASVSIAVVGCGIIGPRHAQSISKCPGAQISAIVEPGSKGAEIAAEYGTRHFRSVAEMLASGQPPDAAIVCTPNSTHVSISEELLRNGVNVLVEKPISTDVESGRHLVRVAQGAGLKLMVGHHRRFNAYLRAAKAQIDSGSLGRILAVNGLWTTYKSQDYFDPPMEWHRSGATAGVVLINLVHEVDLLQYMLGPVTRVHAEATASQRGYAAEEGAALTLRFASGAVGTFLVCDAVPSPYNFEAGTGENPMIPRRGEDFYRIFGSEASLSVPDMTRWSYDGMPAKSWKEQLSQQVVAVDALSTPFDLQVEHLVRVVRGEEEPICPGSAGLQAMIVCDAVKRALATGQTVDIPLEG